MAAHTAADYLDAQNPANDAEDTTPLARQAREHVELVERLRDTGHFERLNSTRVMVVVNQKGGVGKTTSSVNLAAAMASRGLRVLLIDLDPQGNASTATGIEHAVGTPGIYDVLVDGLALSEVVQNCPDIPSLMVAPATIDLAGAEIELVSVQQRETRLKNAIDTFITAQADSGMIDYVIIDCPPSLGLLTINAMAAAREVLIPIQCEYYALEGLGQLLRTVELVQGHLNPKLEVSTILLTMNDARTNLAKSVAEEVREHFGDRVLRTAIPRSVRLSEAPGYGQTIITYDPTGTGALSYLEAAREITVRGAQAQEAVK